MEKNWIRYMGLQAQESAREGGDQEGKMRRDRPNEVGNTARQSLPASRGEGTQRVPRQVPAKDSIMKNTKNTELPLFAKLIKMLFRKL